MKCPHCGMIFNGVTDTCPLCGKEVYVGCKKLKSLTTKTYKIGKLDCNIMQLCLIFAVNVAIVSLIVNLSTGIGKLWSAFPIVGIFTLYFIFSMMLGYTSVASGIRRLALLHFAGASALQFLFFKEWWMYGYYLPAFLIAINLVVCIVFFLPNTKRVSLFFSELLLALMGATLLILMETSVVATNEVSRVLIITSFAIVACVFANYSIYMLFCLKDKFRTIIK